MRITRPRARAADAGWRPDALLDGFECRDLPLSDIPEAGEADHALVATLVRRADPGLRASPRAWLYVHGWNDYFFQVHLAEAVEALGYAFYAIDLRRYGRSYREGMFFGYVNDLDTYAEELDAAAEIIAARHDSLVLMGHSTGGLTAALWASERPGLLDGLVLNAPWLDLQGPPTVAALIRPLLHQLSRSRGTTTLPVPQDDARIYARATHESYDGEWAYDVTLKSDRPRPLRVGWMRAILAGHRRVAQGLDIDCPVFVAVSARTVWLRRWAESARDSDTVLDIDRIAAAATRLGRHLTLVRIPGAVHDIMLSRPEVRDDFVRELGRWVRGYLPRPDAAG